MWELAGGIVIDILAAATLVLLFLWERGGGPRWVVSSRQLSHLVLPWAAPLLLAAIALGRWLSAGAFALALVGFALRFGSRVWRRPRARAPEVVGGGVGASTGDGPVLTVCTYNIGWGRSDPADIARFLRRSGADFVGLQEVAERHVEPLREILSDVYPHQVLHGTGRSGIGVLSREPLAEVDLLTLEGNHAYLVGNLHWNDHRIAFACVHPDARIGFLGAAAPEAADLEALATRAHARAPALVLGDFNTTDQSDPYRAMAAAGLVDAHVTAHGGWGFTFPIWRRYYGTPAPPFLRLDQVWHTRDLRAVHCEVGPDAGSDHLPVIAKLVPVRETGRGRPGGRMNHGR